MLSAQAHVLRQLCQSFAAGSHLGQALRSLHSTQLNSIPQYGG